MKPLLLSVLSTISVVLGVAGLGILVWGILRLRQSARTKHWPTVTGTIRSSTVTAREAPAMRQDSSEDEDAPQRPPAVLYRPQVEYTYTVDGHAYTGTSLGRDVVEVSSRQHAQDHAARYVPRAQVKVFYDPENPSRALLEPGLQATSWAIPAAGAACLIVTTAFYFFIRWFSGR